MGTKEADGIHNTTDNGKKVIGLTNASSTIATTTTPSPTPTTLATLTPSPSEQNNRVSPKRDSSGDELTNGSGGGAASVKSVKSANSSTGDVVDGNDKKRSPSDGANAININNNQDNGNAVEERTLEKSAIAAGENSPTLLDPKTARIEPNKQRKSPDDDNNLNADTNGSGRFSKNTK